MTGTQLHQYVVCWPIEDSGPSMHALIEQATADLPVLAAALGVELVEGRRPEFYRLDGFPPRLCASTVARVIDPARLAARQSKDAAVVGRLIAAGVRPEEIRRRTLLHPAYINHVMAEAVRPDAQAPKDRRSA